jgi:hypothetical protein
MNFLKIPLYLFIFFHQKKKVKNLKMKRSARSKNFQKLRILTNNDSILRKSLPHFRNNHFNIFRKKYKISIRPSPHSSSLYATCTFTLSSFPLLHPPKPINSIEKNNLKKTRTPWRVHFLNTSDKRPS